MFHCSKLSILWELLLSMILICNSDSTPPLRIDPLGSCVCMSTLIEISTHCTKNNAPITLIENSIQFFYQFSSKTIMTSKSILNSSSTTKQIQGQFLNVFLILIKFDSNSKHHSLLFTFTFSYKWIKHTCSILTGIKNTWLKYS
jgi:hypothetical protein